jgi:cell division protein FtsQ
MLTNASKAGVGLALVLSTAAATAWGGYRLALSSPRFSVQRLEVETSQRYDETELAQRAGVELGSSLLALDLHAAEQRLLSDPWVESVRITRKLPHTLRVQLREHEAAALAALDGEIFLIDAKGEPFKAWQGGDTHDLPVLTGVTLEALAKDRAGAVARFSTALSVLEHYERLPVSRVQRAQEVHLAPDGAVVLVVGARGVSLHLGHGPWPKKLLMVAEVLRQFDRQKELPGIVFLDNELHPERVVVRMR